MKSHRLLIISFLVVITIAFAKATFAQAPKDPLYVDLSKALGFVMGQRFSLNRIKAEYPALSLLVQKADLEFMTAFGTAEKNIEKALSGIFKGEYPAYVAKVKKQLQSTLKSQRISQDIAVQFINEVESRAKGNLPSPVLETILNYQFEKRPADELLRGFKATYRTKGHPKAKGLDYQVEYPKSWSLREGKRPNVIQFFSSNNGRGPANALIMTRDILKEAQGQLSREEIRALSTPQGSKELASELFSEDSLREIMNGMGMTNTRNISSKRVTLDRWPGAMLEFSGEQQRLDFFVTMYNRLYIALYKTYMISLQCQIAKYPDDTEDMLKTKIARFASLFHFMANSLVIQSQY